MYQDIRHSDAWSSYLEMYGWKSIKTSSGNVVRISNMPIFKKAHMLRPSTLDEQDLFEINDICHENHVFSIKISPNVEQDLGLLKKDSYRATNKIELPPSTMLINLGSEIESLQDALLSGGRYSINKSIRSGDICEFIQKPDGQQISDFFDLLSKRSNNKGFYIPKLNDHLEKVKHFGLHSYIGNVYDKHNRILGTKLFLGHEDTIWGMHAATSKLGQQSCGGYLLLWSSFNYFKSKGYKTMDLDGYYDERFERLSKNWKGYSFFKKQFNGKIIEFPMPYKKYFWKFFI